MRKIINKPERDILIKASILLTKDQIIDKIMQKYGYDASNGLVLRYLDYRDNALAPEKFAYGISYINYLTGKREKWTYWPNSAGLQYTK